MVGFACTPCQATTGHSGEAQPIHTVQLANCIQNASRLSTQVCNDIIVRGVRQKRHQISDWAFLRDCALQQRDGGSVAGYTVSNGQQDSEMPPTCAKNPAHATMARRPFFISFTLLSSNAATSLLRPKGSNRMPPAQRQAS